MVLNTGDMTKKVKNSARPSKTWLGGAEGVPMALRSSPSTMIIRVKQVIISNAAGINVSEVRNTRVCTGSDQFCPPPASGWLIMPGSCAHPLPASDHRPSVNAVIPPARADNRHEETRFMGGAPFFPSPGADAHENPARCRLVHQDPAARA